MTNGRNPELPPSAPGAEVSSGIQANVQTNSTNGTTSSTEFFSSVPSTSDEISPVSQNIPLHQSIFTFPHYELTLEEQLNEVRRASEALRKRELDLISKIESRPYKRRPYNTVEEAELDIATSQTRRLANRHTEATLFLGRPGPDKRSGIYPRKVSSNSAASNSGSAVTLSTGFSGFSSFSSTQSSSDDERTSPFNPSDSSESTGQPQIEDGAGSGTSQHSPNTTARGRGRGRGRPRRPRRGRRPS